MAPDPTRGSLEIVPFGPERWGDFLGLHADAHGAGWCRCVAWWVPTWEGWGERTAEQNLLTRKALCERGEWDGFLALEGGAQAPRRAVGWCQVGPRDRLGKLVAQLGLAPDPAAWAVSCLFVAPDRRRSGVARRLLQGVLEALRERGVSRVEAYPLRQTASEPGELWTGPWTLYAELGFREEGGADPRRSVWRRDLPPAGEARPRQPEDRSDRRSE